MYQADHITAGGAMRRTKALLKSSNPPNLRESRKTSNGSYTRYKKLITTLNHAERLTAVSVMRLSGRLEKLR